MSRFNQLSKFAEDSTRTEWAGSTNCRSLPRTQQEPNEPVQPTVEVCRGLNKNRMSRINQLSKFAEDSTRTEWAGSTNCRSLPRTQQEPNEPVQPTVEVCRGLNKNRMSRFNQLSKFAEDSTRTEWAGSTNCRCLPRTQQESNEPVQPTVEVCRGLNKNRMSRINQLSMFAEDSTRTEWAGSTNCRCLPRTQQEPNEPDQPTVEVCRGLNKNRMSRINQLSKFAEDSTRTEWAGSTNCRSLPRTQQEPNEPVQPTVEVCRGLNKNRMSRINQLSKFAEDSTRTEWAGSTNCRSLQRTQQEPNEPDQPTVEVCRGLNKNRMSRINQLSKFAEDSTRTEWAGSTNCRSLPRTQQEPNEPVQPTVEVCRGLNKNRMSRFNQLSKFAEDSTRTEWAVAKSAEDYRRFWWVRCWHCVCITEDLNEPDAQSFLFY